MLPPHPELKQAVSWIPNDPISEFDQQYRIERLGNGIALPNIQSCTEFPIYIQSWHVFDTTKMSDYEAHALMGYPVEVHMQRGLAYDPMVHHQWPLASFCGYPNVYRATRIMDSEGVVYDIDHDNMGQIVGEVQRRINQNYIFYYYLAVQQVIVPVVVIGHTIDDEDSQAYFEFVQHHDYVRFAGKLSCDLGKVLAPQQFNRRTPNPYKGCTVQAMTKLTESMGKNANMEMWGRMSRRNYAPTPVDQWIEIKANTGDDKSPYGVCSIKPTPCVEFKDSPFGVYFKAESEAELEERISESPSILEVELRKILPELTPLSRKDREIKTKGYITANPYFRKLYEVACNHLNWHETVGASDPTTIIQEKESPVFANNIPRLTDEQRFRVFESGCLNQIKAPLTAYENNVSYNGTFVPYQQAPVDQNGVKFCQGTFYINNASYEYVTTCASYVDALIKVGYHTQIGIHAGQAGASRQVAFNSRTQQASLDDGLSEADMIALWGVSGEPEPNVMVKRAPTSQTSATPFDNMEGYTPTIETTTNDLSQATAELREHLVAGSESVVEGVPVYNLVPEEFGNLTILARGNVMWASKVNRLARVKVPQQGTRVAVVSYDNLAVVLPELKSNAEALKVVLPWCSLIMTNRKKAFYDKLRANTPKPVKSESDDILNSLFGFFGTTPEKEKAPVITTSPAATTTILGVTRNATMTEMAAGTDTPTAPTAAGPQDRRRSLHTTQSSPEDAVPAPAPQVEKRIEPVVEDAMEIGEIEEARDLAAAVDFGPNAALVQQLGSVYAFGGYRVDLGAYIKSLNVVWVKDAEEVKSLLRDVVQNLKSGRFDLLPVGAAFPQKVTDACVASGVQKVDLAPWCFARQTPVTELDPNEVHTVKAYFLFIRDLIKVGNSTSTVTGAPALLGMAQAEFEKLKKVAPPATTSVVNEVTLNAKMVEAAELLDRTTFIFGSGIEPVLRTSEHPLTVRRMAAAMLNMHPTAVAFASMEEIPDTSTGKKWAQVIRKARSIIRETGAAAGSRIIESYEDDGLTVVGSPWVDDIDGNEWVSLVKEEYENLFGDIGWIRPSFGEAMVDTIAFARVMDLASVRGELAERVNGIIANKQQIIDMATQIDDLKSRTIKQTYNLQGVAGCVACVARELPLASDRRQTASTVKIVEETVIRDDQPMQESLVQITLHFEKDNQLDMALKKIDSGTGDIAKLTVVEDLDEWSVEAFPQPELSYVTSLGVHLTPEDLAEDENVDLIDKLVPVKTFIPTVYVPIITDNHETRNLQGRENELAVHCAVEYKSFDDGGALINYIKNYKERVSKSEFGLLSEYTKLIGDDLIACVDDDQAATVNRGWSYMEVARFARLITNTVNDHLRVALGLTAYIPDVLTSDKSVYENIIDGVLSFNICGAGLMVDILEDMTKRENDGEHLDEPKGASIVAKTVFHVVTTRLSNNIGVRNVGREGKLIKLDECGEFINTLIKALEFAFAGMATTPPVVLFTGCGNTYTIRNHNHCWMIAME